MCLGQYISTCKVLNPPCTCNFPHLLLKLFFVVLNKGSSTNSSWSRTQQLQSSQRLLPLTTSLSYWKSSTGCLFISELIHFPGHSPPLPLHICLTSSISARSLRSSASSRLTELLSTSAPRGAELSVALSLNSGTYFHQTSVTLIHSLSLNQISSI